MNCEVCGKACSVIIAEIEGARLTVCESCAKLGKIIYIQSTAPSKKREKVPKSLKEEYELVDDFGERIRNARMRMRIPLAVLAELLNEKEGFLERIEKGKTLPSISLARKLEKELGIKLLEPA